MADRQPKLFVLRVAFFAAFFVQVVFSHVLTSTSIKISASNINTSAVEVRFAGNQTLLSNPSVSGNATSFTIKNLHPGTLYNITALLSSSSWVLTTRPLEPTNITEIIVTGTNVSIKWQFDKQKSGGDLWLIKYKVENADTYKEKNRSLQSIQLILLEDGTKYEVEIWTVANSKTSETFLNTSFVTDPDALSNATVKTNGRNITVIWEKQPSFTYTACLTNVPTCSEKKNISTHTFTDLVAGKSYDLSIIVHAYDKNSSEYNSTIILPPLPPTNVLKHSITTNSANITWSFNKTLSQGSEWLIKYKTDSHPYKNKTSDKQSIELTTLVDGEKYEVKIWTRSNMVYSESPATGSFVTLPEALSEATIISTGKNITVTWSQRNHFTYTICLTNISRCSENQTANTSTFNNLTPGMNYTVSIVVHAYGKNSSAYRNSVVVPPLPPTNVLEHSTTTDSANITWSFNKTLSQGSEWLIQYKTDSHLYKNETSDKQRIELTSLDDGEKYEVKIWTRSNMVYSESPATGSFVTLPEALSEATIISTGKNITVTWSQRKHFTYTICLTDISRCSENQTANTSTFNNLTPGMNYTVSIVVHAYGKNSSAYRDSVVVSPLPPTNVLKHSITTNSANITWSFNKTLSQGSKWLIQYKRDSHPYKNRTSNKQSIELTSLDDGEKYEVKIWTRSYMVYSESPATDSFVTYPKAASNFTIDTKERNIIVTWERRKRFLYTVCLTNIHNCSKKKNTSTYTFTDQVAGKSYNVSIIVHAYDKNSSEYEKTRILPPLPPTNVTKNLTNNKLFMEWYIDSNITVASEWRIEYSTENDTKYLNTSIRNATLNLVSGKEYEIKIWSISLGVMSETFLLTNLYTAPEEVLDIIAKENDSQLTVSWSPPSQSTITRYRIGYSESCSRSQDCLSCKKVKQNTGGSGFKVTRSNDINETSYTFSTKPGCCYHIIIWAFNSVVQGKPTYHKCRTTSYKPPVENKPDNIQLASATTESVTVTLKPNPFKETQGPIINYNIIIATDKSMKHTNKRELPTWKKFKDDGNIKAYQIFWNCSNLYEKSNACSNFHSKSKRSLDEAIKYSIGTENCENAKSFCNGHLMPDTEYYIKVRAYTFDEFSDTDYSPAIKTEKEKMEGYLIAIIVLIILLIIVVIVGIVLYMVRRKKTKPKPVVPTDSPYIMQPTSHPVRATDFESHFTQMSADSDYRFAEEYESVKEVGKHNQTLAAHLTSNRIKNRFVNILPYDFSRVKLTKASDDDDEGSDYINANYIPGFTSRREYIATQGPLSSTRDDFWRMVWEQNVHNIVMLANCIEKHREKCDHYWPDNDETRCYGNIKVEKLNETITSDWTVTEFLMSNPDRVTRHLHHFHFTSWPDFGVPSNPQSIITFVRLVRNKLQNIGPLVIHCSAGVGRTGTFISVDRSLQDLEKNNEVDVLRVVHEMRQHRSFMVQTEEQYIYIHRCILYAIQGDNKDIYENETYMNENIYENTNAGHVNKAFLYDDEGIHVDST
ncbi:receptortyrosineH-likeproteintype phosphatase 10D-like isoform X1 [Octopus vulgaris]|uniref:protein-tyrosine-phosphatase n=1 Tax=Octopus vulgaris TaxID=6645 RepID=A0AA36EXQ5_OCTVU|nr:receptortyrosineH-likeproteintype phosphatase 10D-like isoform X1 [Octopus vulgaris]